MKARKGMENFIAGTALKVRRRRRHCRRAWHLLGPRSQRVAGIVRHAGGAGGAACGQVNHLSMMELNNTRQFVLRALDELLDLQGTSDKDEDVVPAAGAAAGAATPAGPAVRQRS